MVAESSETEEYLSLMVRGSAGRDIIRAPTERRDRRSHQGLNCFPYVSVRSPRPVDAHSFHLKSSRMVGPCVWRNLSPSRGMESRDRCRPCIIAGSQTPTDTNVGVCFVPVVERTDVNTLAW